MSKARMLLIFGVWIAVLPYLGFPYSWKDVLFTLSGLGLIYFSFMLYRESNKGQSKNGNFDNFRENGHFAKNKAATEVYAEEDGEALK